MEASKDDDPPLGLEGPTEEIVEIVYINGKRKKKIKRRVKKKKALTQE
jgi:hypothetical protein